MHLFVQGERGVGKSTLLRQALLPYEEELAGFVVQRLFTGTRPVGFRAATLKNGFPPMGEEYTGQAGAFILGKHMDIAILEAIMTQVEKAAKSPECRLVFLDEIGGIEILSQDFMDAFWRILNSGKPCLGVWKSKENLRHMASALRLPQEYLERHQAVENRLTQNGRIVTMETGNRESVRECVLGFIQTL